MAELTSTLWTCTRLLSRPFRLEPLDVSCGQSRSRQRIYRATVTTATSVIAKAVSMFAILISVPLTVRYLGQERYGLWMTITSLFALLSFADLGLGIGLLNLIANAHGKEDREEASALIASAFFMMLGIAALVLVSLALAYPMIPWTRLFNVKSPLAIMEAGPTAVAFVACFAVGLPLSVVQRVQMGYQEGALVNIWACLASLFGLLGLLLAVRLNAGLPWLVIAVSGSPQVCLAGNSLLYFGRQRRWLRPRWSKAQSGQASRLFGLGIQFFVLNFLYLSSYGLDNLIISHTLGNESVTKYSVCIKYLSIGLILTNLANQSLWAAYGEALAREDWAWLKQTLHRAFWLSLLSASGFTLILVVVSNSVVRAWVGPECVPSLGLLCAVGVWGTVDAVRVTLSTFFNALNVVRFQVISFGLFALGGLAVKICLIRVLGLEGMVFGGIVIYLMTIMIPMLWFTRLKFTEFDRNQGES